MAKTKVYAPEGHHFMVNNEGGFYLMKNPVSGYKAHTVNKEKSSLYVLLEVKDHVSATNTTVASSSTYSNTTTTRSSNSRVARPSRSSRSSSSTGNSSGSSGGGGY